MQELRVKIFGRVQMVMFRDFVQRKARSIKLVGHVKNLPDGSVEVIAQGERHALEGLLEKLRHGPILSRVDKIDVEWRDATGRYGDFIIVR